MKKTDLPQILPIFPLHGVMLLPGGRLPLNIFEDRYLAMFDEALKTSRLIGMIQPKVSGEKHLYDIGCAGRIVEFTETADGRYEIVLSGLLRFRVDQELDILDGYRRVEPDWSNYLDDICEEKTCLGLKRDKLKQLVGDYFKREGMHCDWDAFDGATDGRLMTCLSMACPLQPAEKQALLEEKCCKKRAQMFMTLLEMEICHCACHSEEGINK